MTDADEPHLNLNDGTNEQSQSATVSSGLGDSTTNNSQNRDTESETAEQSSDSGTDTGEQSTSQSEQTSSTNSASTTSYEANPLKVNAEPPQIQDVTGDKRSQLVLDQTANIPGTEFRQAYAYARLGKSGSTVSWGREKTRRFDTFEDTEQMVEAAVQHFSEDVYPQVDIMKADVSEALMLAGLLHLDTTKDILDQWGFGLMNQQ